MLTAAWLWSVRLAYGYFANDIKGKVVEPLVDLERLACSGKRSHSVEEGDLGLVDFVLDVNERTHVVEASSLSSSFGMALDVTLSEEVLFGTRESPARVSCRLLDVSGWRYEMVSMNKPSVVDLWVYI